MRILIKGDPHNKLEQFRNEINETGVDLALCVGDLGFYPDLSVLKKVDPKAEIKNGEIVAYDVTKKFFDKLVITVPGNHEDNEWLDDNAVMGVTYLDNLMFLTNNFTKLKENLYVFGFGKIGVQTTLDNYTEEMIRNIGCRNGRKSQSGLIKRRNHFTREQIARAVRKIETFNSHRDWNKDQVIWISHDAPPHRSERGFPVGSAYIHDFLMLLDPTYAFFGHYHYAYSFETNYEIIPKYEYKILEI